MRSVETLVIGAGQAGLSLSGYLTRAGRSHAVLERGRIGERWRSERWDSLALLTPNWLNRLDGGPGHPDADGFLVRDEFVRYLDRYSRSFRAPVLEHVSVAAVERAGPGFHIGSSAGSWRAGNVVIATGDMGVAFVPGVAAAVPDQIVQMHSSAYRNPSALRPGGVLVVGAGPSGQQIALELRRAGRDVIIAAGRHARMVRRYRGKDIWHWLKEIGSLDETIDQVPSPEASRRAPSFTLTGVDGGKQLDLAVLDRLGVIVAGRLEGFGGRRALFAADVQTNIADADRRMKRVLDRIDDHIERTWRGAWPHRDNRPPDVDLPGSPGSLDLDAAGVTTVIWATGYQREYPWLHVDALDPAGELIHERGVTRVPGLYALGLRFQYRRSSHIIGGVGHDAAFIAEHISGRVRATPAPGRTRPLARPETTGRQFASFARR